VKAPLPCRLPLLLCLAFGPGFLVAADQPAPAPAAAKPAAEAPIELPKMEVTAQRVKKIDKEIKRIDKLIVREQAKVKSTELDKALNNEKVAHAAAIFGGNSADHMSLVAASRVMLLEQERDVLEAMKRPATIDEFKMMEAQIEEIRTTRRNLDDATKQR
jgi:hypothetical protein